MAATIEHKTPTVDEFILLRSTTNWSQLSRESIQVALENTLFAVCLYDGENLIGSGRVIGDGSVYFYLQDVIVMPAYRGKGYGKIVVNELMEHIKSIGHPNTFVGLMSALGTKEFYNRLGFTERPVERPGMTMILNSLH